jgi:glycerophosphoryl diester phosphodiesterase
MGLLLKEKVMHDEQHEPVIKAIKSQTSLPTAHEEQVQRAAHHSFGWKRELAVFAIQLCVVVVVYFVTQMFLFIETQAPYYQKQIMVWGHRGAWTDGVCENCADAFTFAKSKGYHGVEFDMRLTKDNVLAVMHDTTLDRTTNGTGPIKEIMLGDLQKLSLRKEGSDAFADHELNYPYTMDEVIEVCLERNAMMNIEAKQDANMTVIPNVLNAVCRHNATQMAFLSTGDLKFQHQLMHMEPEVSLERDFLLHTSAMAQTVPPNVNIYGISAELLLFNTWVISVAHQADQMLLVYFLAIETPAMINYFIALGADGFLLNNPDHCVAAGVCTPAMNFTIPRTIQPWPGPGAYSW